MKKVLKETELLQIRQTCVSMNVQKRVIPLEGITAAFDVFSVKTNRRAVLNIVDIEKSELLNKLNKAISMRRSRTDFKKIVS